MTRMQILDYCLLTVLLQMLFLKAQCYRKEPCFILYNENCDIIFLDTDKNQAFGVRVVPCCMYQYSPVYFLIRWT